MPAVAQLGLCQCGCGEETGRYTRTNMTKGYRKGDHHRYINGHESRKHFPYTEEDRGYSSPCWIWQAYCDPHGYGRTTWKSDRPRKAHRVVYEAMRDPIPEGLDLDHLCFVPACVNPDHMEPVSHRINVRRRRGTKLSEVAAAEIRESSLDALVLADRYGVSRRTIYAVRGGDTWT